MASPSRNSEALAEIPYQGRSSQHQKTATSTRTEPHWSFEVRHEFDDVDELAEVARSWDVDFRQLNRGPFEGRVTQVGGPQFQLAQVRLRGLIHQHGAAPAGLITVAVPAVRDIDLLWRGHTVCRDEILVFGPGGELESTSREDFNMLLVSIPEEPLLTAARQVGIELPSRIVSRLEVVACEPSAVADLRQCIAAQLASMGHDRVAGDIPTEARDPVAMLSDRIVRCLMPSLRGSNDRRRSRRRRLIEEAVEIARHRSRSIHTVRHLRRETGASERTLRRGFQERFGVSPKTYLQAQRLIGVRRRLRALTETERITDVANEWGFWHMGQFAADYRRHFGELPSETVANASGHSL